MCMNIDTSLAVSKRWEEEELLPARNFDRSKITRQRQLGLLRGSHSADVLTRRIKTVDELSSHRTIRDRFHTNGRENRYPVDKNGPSLLSREKLRMLRQIRAENAETLSKACDKQNNSMPPSSAPHSTDFIDNNYRAMGSETGIKETQNDKKGTANNKLHTTLQITAGDGVPSRRNILHELRERSKYLPALMKEFKKLEVKCPIDAQVGLNTYPRNSGAVNTIPDITCATILAAIRTTKENQGSKRALSAPSPGKASQRASFSRKPQSSMASGLRSFKYSPTRSGVNIAPGVNAVYSHIPTPPRRKIQTPLTTSYPAPIITNDENLCGNVTSHCVRRGRSPAGRIWSAGNCSQIHATRGTSKKEDLLSCTQLCLNRSKSASQLAQIHSSPGKFAGDRFERPRMRLPPKPKIESKKKNNRMVRFSEEGDKVFEYLKEDKTARPQKMDDSVFVYTTTANLRKCLDERLGHHASMKR